MIIIQNSNLVASRIGAAVGTWLEHASPCTWRNCIKSVAFAKRYVF